MTNDSHYLNSAVFLMKFRLEFLNNCIIFIHIYKILTKEVEKQQMNLKWRALIELGCLGCHQAVGYPKMEFSFYAVKILPTYNVT